MRTTPAFAVIHNNVSKAIEKAIACRPLNALITETFDIANQQYEMAIKAGMEPFTMVIKDCFAVDGVRMTCASKMLYNYISPYTATCVQRLLNKGGCLIGKANMDEFAMGSTSKNSYFGPVKHFSHYKNIEAGIIEADDWHVAGGSSGGCGVAVALGMARVALGSDTGGSTRNPAAFNGIFGFKPSYGTLSRHGLVPLANSFDVPSIFANSAKDCKIFYDIMRGVDEMDSTSIAAKMPTQDLNTKKFRIGIPKEYNNDLLSQDSKKMWDLAAEAFRSLGYDVKEISLPFTDLSIVCYHILAESDIASNMARYFSLIKLFDKLSKESKYDGVRFGFRAEDGKYFDEVLTNSRTDALQYSVKRRIFAGNFFNIKENRGKYYLQASKIRRLIKNDFDKSFQQVDAIVAPTTSHSAPLDSEVRQENFRERQRKDDYFTQPANMAGLPAISVPVGNCLNGLPLGVQVICDYLNDEQCLYLAQALSKALSLL